MLSKDEFKLLFKNCDDIDHAYDLYIELSQPILVNAAIQIINSEDERLKFLRNCLCTNHLVEISPDEMNKLLEVLRFIVETNIYE